jgi:hypothetical protein
MKSSSTNNNNKKFHLIINGDKRSSYLFVIATIPVLVGITGAFWDLTYHTLNKVDTFFQPAHLVIYNSIFAALLIGIVIALKTRYLSLAIISGVQLATGFTDLMWHNAFGFDSFLSPPHTVLVITAVLQPWLLFRKLCELDSEIGKVVSLGTLWLSITFLLLEFSLASNRTEITSFYIIPPQIVSLIVSALMMPILSVLIAVTSRSIGIKHIYVSCIYFAAIAISTLISNYYVTFTMPFLIVGTIIPAIIYDKYERLGSILFAAIWIITYVPYSFRIIVYAINGQIFGTSHTFALSYSLAGYYPTLVLMGTASGSIFYYLYTRYNLPKILLTMTHQITPRNKQR